MNFITPHRLRANDLASRLGERAEDVVRYLLPKGRRIGQEWRVGGTDGAEGQSLGVHLDGQKAGIWADFSTDQRGDLIGLWMAVRGLDWRAACKEAMDWLGIREDRVDAPSKRYRRPDAKRSIAPLAPEHRAWLTNERKITPATLKAYRVGTKNGAIMFPSLRAGELIAAKYRKLPKTFHQEAHCEPCLFGWQAQAPDARSAIICEGEMDAMAWHVYGFPALSVPMGGGGGAKQGWIATEFDRLALLDTIYVNLDADVPGQQGEREIVSRLGRERCRVVRLPRKDANQCLMDGIPVEDMARALREARPLMQEGDSGDGGDSASHKGLAGPPRPVGSGDGGDASVPHAHFLLLESPQHNLPAGVYWCDTTRDRDGNITGMAVPIWICSPLKVTAVTRDAQGGEWGRLLVFDDHDGKEHRWTMPMRLLAGSGEELRSELLAAGLHITSSARERAKLTDYIMREHPAVTARCVRRTGWHGDVFVLPRQTFGDSDAEPVLFQAATMEGVALGQSGTLEGWIENVATRCAGNARLVLAICSAFAGPCLGLLGMAGGGIHLRGASSTGKTTALEVAISVLGSPEYMRTWRHTDNGLEGVAGMHSDLLLVLDEIGELAPKIAGQTAYMLANGQGKGRAARDGSPRALTTWRVLFLSSGEVGLSELVTQSGGKVRAGQEVRVIDLPADAGAGHGLFDEAPPGMTAGAFADALKSASATHYGHALLAFLRGLVADPAKARAVLTGMRDGIAMEMASGDADGQVRRVAQRFALIAAAGELATAFGLTGWATGEAQRAADVCFKAWMAGRGTMGAAEPVAMREQVKAFLSAHGESRFTRWDAPADGVRTINRAGYVRSGAKGPTYYVEDTAFKREVCGGYDHRAVAQALADVGALEVDSDGRLNKKPRLPDGGSRRVFVITPQLWGDE